MAPPNGVTLTQTAGTAPRAPEGGAMGRLSGAPLAHYASV
jgi:hypothetical protein